MKHTKRIASVLLVLVMALALMVPALAANTNSHTITIDYEKPGHTYTAYQIFKGDIANGKLTNIEWGSGVDGAAVLTALNALASYKDCKDAKDVADVLAGPFGYALRLFQRDKISLYDQCDRRRLLSGEGYGYDC